MTQDVLIGVLVGVIIGGVGGFLAHILNKRYDTGKARKLGLRIIDAVDEAKFRRTVLCMLAALTDDEMNGLGEKFKVCLKRAEDNYDKEQKKEYELNEQMKHSLKN